MTAVMGRARATLAAGRAWKARDRLVGALVARADDELLDLLGHVHFTMGDLPAAGAAWFGSSREDADALAALAAWRERHRDDAVQLWLSLPPLVRNARAPARVEALHREVLDVAHSRRRARAQREQARSATGQHRGLLWGEAALGGVALALMVCLVVGAVTVTRWLFG